MTIACCQCHRVKVAGEWNHPTDSGNARVSHTYCPTCLDEAVEKLRGREVAASSLQPTAA